MTNTSEIPTNSFGAVAPLTITNDSLSAYEESVQENGLNTIIQMKRQIFETEARLQVEQRKLAKFISDNRVEQIVENFPTLQQIKELLKTELEASFWSMVDSVKTESEGALSSKVDSLKTELKASSNRLKSLIEDSDEASGRDYYALKMQISTLDEKLSRELFEVRGQLSGLQSSLKEIEYRTAVTHNILLFEHNRDVLPIGFVEGSKPESLPVFRNLNELHRLTSDEVKTYLLGYKMPFSEEEEEITSLFHKLREATGMMSY